MALSLPELAADQLQRRCACDGIPFASTAEAPVLDEIIGQDRASRAIEFGIDIRHPGYNIYAMGPSGAGKTSTITGYLRRKAGTRAVPPDWGYVHNQAEPDRPRAVRLPPGGGARLRQQLDAALAQAAEALPAAFAGDHYAERRQALEREFDGRRADRFREAEAYLAERGFTLARTEGGIIMVPARGGEALTQEQFEALTPSDHQALEEKGPEAQAALERALRQVREIDGDAQDRQGALNQEVAAAAVAPLFAPLHDEYAGWPDVTRHLADIVSHMALHPERLQARAGDSNAASMAAVAAAAAATAAGQPQSLQAESASPLDRYRINLIVDNQGLEGAPVIVETHPTYQNLVGRIEQRAEYGAFVTDFRHIRAGALHRANGGYLVLDALVMLRQPQAWEALKQALRNESIRMEDMGQEPEVMAAASLIPQPIPLSIKVILIGDSETYYLLYANDEQFEQLFKVRADFAVDMAWTPENMLKIAQFIRNRSEAEGLLHFDGSAVARIVEHSARLVEDQNKLTTLFSQVNDILREASYFAQRAGHSLVFAADVAQALDERVYRSNQYQERLTEMITDGTIMVDTSGSVVGQVNGLAVLELGDYSFGRPNRITASVYQGRTGVLSIEREVRMSGRIHDKGVLTLSGFLGGRFAQDKPLSLSASIAFEQSYEGVDGDSASSSELYALLSGLAGLPVKQGIAVTGSVNQRGDIQAIGGVNDKIEGFFAVCRASAGGLTGEQGVIIPASNARHLMLRDDVVAAVAEGRFHIYAIRSIDQGIEILTGVPAGERDAAGVYPPGSVNGLVDRRLRLLAERQRRFGQSPATGHDASSPATAGPEPEGGAPGEPALPGDEPRTLPED